MDADRDERVCVSAPSRARIVLGALTRLCSPITQLLPEMCPISPCLSINKFAGDGDTFFLPSLYGERVRMRAEEATPHPDPPPQGGREKKARPPPQGGREKKARPPPQGGGRRRLALPHKGGGRRALQPREGLHA